MIYAFLFAQLRYPVKGDFVLQVRKDLEDFNIDSSISYLQSFSKKKFKSLIKEKSFQYAFNKFNKMKQSHSKMKQLFYKELKIQDYLLSPSISNETTKILFRWRIHMEKFDNNFRGGRNEVICSLCNLHCDSQEMAFSCKIIQAEVNIQGNYADLFQNVSLHPKLISTILKISETRSRLIEEK